MNQQTINQIQTSDNFFSKRDHNTILSYCEKCSYTWGEVDNADTPPTGMIHNIPEDEKVYSIVKNRIEESIPDITKMKIYRMYVNCFAPNERPYYHTDQEEGDGLTFLYYPQKDWALDEGGETQFYVDSNLYGIYPEPNRMVMFDAKMLHRATSFRNRYRFTVAVKYN